MTEPVRVLIVRWARENDIDCTLGQLESLAVQLDRPEPIAAAVTYRLQPMTEPGTLPEGIEHKIRSYGMTFTAQENMRNVARLAMAEGAAQERARHADRGKKTDWLALHEGHGHTVTRREDFIECDCGATFWATRTPPPPEVQK